MIYFPTTTSLFSQHILLIVIFVRAVLSIVLGFICFCPLVSVSLQNADKSQKDSCPTFSPFPPFVIIPWIFLAIITACGFVYVRLPVWASSYWASGNLRTSTETNGREDEEGEYSRAALRWINAGVCVSARIIYSAGCMRRRNLQVVDAKATQFIRDCKHEPDKYILCHVPHLSGCM